MSSPDYQHIRPVHVDPEPCADANTGSVKNRSSKRSKRRLSGDVTDESGLSLEDLRDTIRSEIKAAFSTEITRMFDDHLKNLFEKIAGFDAALSFNNTLLEDMKNKLDEKVFIIEKLEKENIDLRSTVYGLSERLNSIEQNLRETNVEINGLPEHRSENLLNVVLQLGKIVECPINNEEIQHATRVAKLNKDSDRPRSVVVKLCKRTTRDHLLAAVTNYNKGHKDDKLSTRHLGLGGKREPIYVSEHLSPHNKHLHAATRQKAKAAQFKFVWVRDGRIYAKKNESSPGIHIRSFDSLALLK